MSLLSIAALPYTKPHLASLNGRLPVDEIDSLCPIIDAQLVDVQRTGHTSLVALCGRSSRSSLRVLQHGLVCSSAERRFDTTYCASAAVTAALITSFVNQCSRDCRAHHEFREPVQQ